jgi:peptidyl-prolyl cis-trans isomerase B (cyclophilin B)
MLATLLAVALGGSVADVEIAVTMPELYVVGEPYFVDVVYTAGAETASIDAWRASPSAFEVARKPLGDRSSKDSIELPKGSSMTLRLDLSSYLDVSGKFKLTLNGAAKDTATEVNVYRPGPGIDYMTSPVEELENYYVLLQTNHGSMLVEFYPDIAPNHVRNFLDLSSSGFYDGSLFHRVSPTFMIQGGCPNTKTNVRKGWGTGSGPRMLEAEFNKRKHVRGILSMARGTSPDSGSCQFFVMTAKYPSLDRKYSVFGNLVSGLDTLEVISNARGQTNPKDGTVKPSEPQRIERADVLTRG